MRGGGTRPIISIMADERVHRIADDLTEDWVEDWADEGISAIESYLAKHAAFLAFLDTQDD